MPYTVILTRPQHRNQVLAQQLKDRGWHVLELPALKLQKQLPAAGQFPMPDGFDAVVFVSSFAATTYLEGLLQHQTPASWPATTLAVTVGYASAVPLYAAGFIPDNVIVHPGVEHGGHDSEALWTRLQDVPQTIERVLVLRGQTGREWLGARFEQSGAEVQRIAIYRRQPADWSDAQKQALKQALQQPEKAIMLLTSSEGVLALYSKVSRLGLLPAWAACRFIAFHQRIASQLQSILQGASLSLTHPVMLCEPSDTAFCQTLGSLPHRHHGS